MSAPRFLLFGCGHRAKVGAISFVRPACPVCRDRRIEEDDRRRIAFEREQRARAAARSRRIASVLDRARLVDEDVPLAAWAGGRS